MRFGYSRHSFLSFILIIIIVLLVAGGAVLGFMLLGDKDGEDDGKIGVNVTSGKVKIDIEDVHGTSLIDQAFDFVLPEGESEVVFAPGFRIRNEGNLEIKYNVFITGDESVDAADFAEAFDLYITTDPDNLESAQKLSTYSSVLKKNTASEVLYLVVCMKDGAGDDFQDRTFTGIGITVHATQSNAPD